MSLPYAALYREPKGPGDSRPTASQIVRDAGAEGTLTGKVAVVTGASSGVGAETVKALLATGLHFILPVRDEERAETALGGMYDSSRIDFVPVDLESLGSVREAARVILSKTEKVHLYIANAGVMATPNLQLTVDGYETQFAVNHLAHFLLFKLLEPAILAASSPDFKPRIVIVSSDAHSGQTLNERGNYNFEDGGYSAQGGYGQSKTANIYMSNEIERRYASKGIHSVALHPGVVLTNLGRYLSDEAIQGLLTYFKDSWLDPSQGAATSVWACLSRELDGKGGLYLAQCRIGVPHVEEKKREQYGFEHSSHVFSPENEGRLWNDSLEMVKEFL